MPIGREPGFPGSVPGPLRLRLIPVPGRITLLAAIYVATYFLWQALVGHQSAYGAAVGLLAFVPLSAATGVRFWLARRNQGLAAGYRTGLGYLGTTYGCIALGSSIWFVQQFLQHRDPTYSWGNLPYLASYLLGAAGVLAFPAGPQGRRIWWKLALDAAIVITASVTMAWFWVIRPLSEVAVPTLGHRLVLIAYPVGSLIFFAALAPRLLDPEWRIRDWAVPLFLTGQTAHLLAGLGYQLTPVTSSGVTWQDVLFCVGYLLMLWSGERFQRAELAPPRSTAETALYLRWNPIPLLLSLTVCALWARAAVSPWDDPRSGLAAAILALILLILIRETWTVRENLRLVRQNAERRGLERFREIIQGVYVGVLVADAESKPVMVNRAAADLLGVSEDELMGRSAFHPQWRAVKDDGSPFPPEEWPVPVAIRTRRPVRGVVMGIDRPSRGDRVWLLADAAPDLDPSGRTLQVLCTFHDISDRRALEEKLHQAQRMEAVGQLAGGVAHDFNNLLTAITGYAALLKADLDAGDPRGEDVDQIRTAARRAADLTQQLLAFGRRQLLDPVVLDLNQVLREKQSLLRSLVGERVSVTLELAPRLWPVAVDRAQMEQVLLNLVVNARDAMPLGGSLTLGTGNRVLDSDPPGGGWVVLTVRDTGYGMDPGTLARAFEPFFTTKEIGKGTGLGLSSVYGVVKQSGGDIRIDSQPGAGTTVTILLPRSHAQPAMPTQGAEPATPTGGETILLVEDEEPLRTVIRRVLDRLGYRVREAGSAEMALAVLRAEPELTVDLLLTDVVMPGGSGVDLAAAIRSLRPDLPVVFISGHADEDVVRYGLDRSDVALLTKPFTPDELGVLIQSRLHPRGRPRVSGAPTLP